MILRTTRHDVCPPLRYHSVEDIEAAPKQWSQAGQRAHSRGHPGAQVPDRKACASSRHVPVRVLWSWALRDCLGESRPLGGLVFEVRELFFTELGRSGIVGLSILRSVYPEHPTQFQMSPEGMALYLVEDHRASRLHIIWWQLRPSFC